MSSSHLANDADLSGGASDEELSPPSDDLPSLSPSFLSLLLDEAVLPLEELDPPPSVRLAASNALESSSDIEALESFLLLFLPDPLPHFLSNSTQPFIGFP